MGDFLQSIGLAAQGLKAQASRMRIIAENMANAGATPAKPGESPYRRKIATFQRALEDGVLGVRIGKTARDSSAFPTRYEPGHPAADAGGMVRTANVDYLVESMDMREAQRSYEANVSVIGATRRMIARTLDILKL